MRAYKIITLGVAMFACSPSAQALCIYGGKHFTKSTERDFNGRLYAKTTLRDEFQDAALVVRGTLLSSRNVGRPDDENLGTIYRIRIDQTFKGNARTIIRDFTNLDSGGFSLGDAGEGKEYLLFLNPLDRHSWAKKAVPDAYEVNYNCGQSRPWGKVSSRDRDELRILSKTGD